jgi:hypothetical protein
MKTFRAILLSISICSLCVPGSSESAFGGQSAQGVNQPAAPSPGQPSADGGDSFQPLGDYVPCLFVEDELYRSRGLDPRDKPEKAKEEKKIGADGALKVFDAMNASIAKLIETYAPSFAPLFPGAPAGLQYDVNANSRSFVQDFAQRFFEEETPETIKTMTAIEAYTELSTAASRVGAAISSEIVGKEGSGSKYFNYPLTSTTTVEKDAAVQAEVTHIQSVLMSAVRSTSTEALASKPRQLYNPPTDISCSVSVMGWKETSDNFGRRVANQFVAIQVTVRNLNTKNEFLMHDIQVAVDTGLSPDSYFYKQYAGRFQAGRDKLLVRGVAQRGQSEDRRNLALNALAAAGAIAGASAVGGTPDFKSGVAVFEGAFLPGLSTLFPDHTVEQLNRINDLVFSASNTSKVLVPIQGSVPLVTFIPEKPIEQLPFAWCGYKREDDPQRPCIYDPFKTDDSSFPHQSFLLQDGNGTPRDIEKPWKSLAYSDWKGAALRILENHLFVVIGGVHIQELTNEPPKIANLDCPTIPGGAVDITQAKDGVISCSVTGNSLDKVSSVNLEKGSEKIAGKVKAAKDGNSATLIFDPSALSDGNGMYSLYMVTSDSSGNSTEVDSGEKVSLVPTTYIASVGSPLDLSKVPMDPLKFSGKHLDLIGSVYLVQGENAVEATADGKPTVTQDTATATFDPSKLITKTTYHLRYTLKSQLSKPVDWPYLTVTTTNQAPAAAGKTSPAITKLSAMAGPVGTKVTITGTGFGAQQPTSTVTFGGTQGMPTSWNDTSIVVPVPAGVKDGNAPIIVTVGGVASKSVNFTVGTVPAITKLSASSGLVATSITITGTNFGAMQGTSTVTFGGIKGSPTSWSDSSIVVPVPTGVKNGNAPIVVTVGGVSNAGYKFIVGPVPAIKALSSTTGPVGTPITVTGTNFGAAQGTSSISFGKSKGTPTNWSDTSIVVPVPAGAKTGNVVVTVNGVASNSSMFNIP